MSIDADPQVILNFLARLALYEEEAEAPSDPSRLLERYRRIAGVDSPDSSFIESVVELLKGVDLPMKAGVGAGRLNVTATEVGALLSLATSLPAPNLLVSWAVFGPDEVRTRSASALVALDPNIAVDAVIQCFVSLPGTSPFAGRIGKSRRKTLVQLLAPMIRQVPKSDFPYTTILETTSTLAVRYDIDVADALLATVFSKTRIKETNESDLAHLASTLRSALRSLSRGKCTSKTARGILLTLLSFCSPLPEDIEFWRGIPFHEVQKLASEKRVRGRLVSDPFRQLLIDELRNEIQKVSLSSAFQLLTNFPELDPDDFSDLFTARIKGSSREAKLFRHLATVSAQNQIRSETSRAKGLLEEAALQKIQEAELRASDAEATLVEQVELVKTLKEQIKSLGSANLSLVDYEKAQARHDALHELMDIVERLRPWEGVAEIGPEVLIGLVQIVDRKLDSLGIEVVGKVGVTMSSDHDLFEFVDRKQSELFVVVSPAYRLKSDVTSVFRKGVASHP